MRRLGIKCVAFGVVPLVFLAGRTANCASDDGVASSWRAANWRALAAAASRQPRRRRGAQSRGRTDQQQQPKRAKGGRKPARQQRPMNNKCTSRFFVEVSSNASVTKAPNNTPQKNPRTKTTLCRRRRPVYFLHLHKAAGTTFCALMRANGWCAPESRDRRDAALFFGKNCNPSLPDAKAALWGDATELVKYGVRHRLDLWANEWTLPEKVYPRTVHLVISVRDPIRRVFSHCGSQSSIQALEACARRSEMTNFAVTKLAACDRAWRSPDKMTALLKPAGGGASEDDKGRESRYVDAVAPPPRCDGRVRPYAAWVPRPFRNEREVRDLFASPLLLDSAKRRLELFETVLVVERFAEAADLVRRTFEWAKVSDVAAQHHGTHQKTDQRVAQLKALAAKLRPLNANDLELYAHANRLFDRQLQRLHGVSSSSEEAGSSESSVSTVSGRRRRTTAVSEDHRQSPSFHSNTTTHRSHAASASTTTTTTEAPRTEAYLPEWCLPGT